MGDGMIGGMIDGIFHSEGQTSLARNFTAFAYRLSHQFPVSATLLFFFKWNVHTGTGFPGHSLCPERRSVKAVDFIYTDRGARSDQARAVLE
jgi:hypothetical protein